MSLDIVFRTNDSGRWGTGLGYDLPAARIDLNFWALKTSVEALQIAIPAASVAISYFSVSGSQFYVHMSDHTILGPYDLPQNIWNFRGAWLATTSYFINDVITANGSTYLVLQDHTSGSSFDPNATDGLGHNLYGLLLAPATGLPAGGLIGSVLMKSGAADYAATWAPVGALIPHKEIDTTTYTLTSDDAGYYLRCTNVYGCTIYVSAMPDVKVGATFNFRQAAGDLVFSPQSGGVTLNGVSGYLLQTGATGSTAAIYCYETNAFDLYGLLKKSP